MMAKEWQFKEFEGKVVVSLPIYIFKNVETAFQFSLQVDENAKVLNAKDGDE